MDLSKLSPDTLATISYQEGFAQGGQMAGSVPEPQRKKFLEGFRAAVAQTLDQDAMLYAAGGQSARHAMQQGLSGEQMLQGLEDHLAGNEPPFAREQVAAAYQSLQQLQDSSPAAGGDARENLERGQAFLQENAGKDEVTTTDSGLQYTVLTPGEGDKPSSSDTVTVHYTGRLLDGTVFDSSVERGEPLAFPLNRVIPGWTEGVQLMSPGAKYRFWIPAGLAYGEQAPPAIGPNQVLDFEVELLQIEPHTHGRG